jgi:predicted phosphodiesterase
MDRTLHFQEDGTFTIVQFTDLHWQNGEPGDRKTRDLMERVLRAEKPDLIVFTGDLIYSAKCRDPRRSLREAVAAAEASGIPWAAVFGNHDAESEVSRGMLMEVMREFPGCVAEAGPERLHGVGNYRIVVADQAGDRKAALYFLDSGSVSELPEVPGYDWIRDNQIGWYKEESRRLAEENGGAGVPGLVFFHIPVPEYEEMWRTQVCYGSRHERAASPRLNSGFLAAMAERGDILGTFCGHDHTNDYGGRFHGVRLYYGRASGYQGYGRPGYARGARIIRLEAGKSDFRTWVRLHNGRVIRTPPVHRPWFYWFRERIRKLF